MLPYLPGRPVSGFHEAFEAGYGDPRSPTPYPIVTPSRIAGAMLPFPCPRCGGVVDFSDGTARERYRDGRPGRGNHFCPHCGARFYLALDGTDVPNVLGADGTAPALVEFVAGGTRGGALQRRVIGGKRGATFADFYLAGTAVLGAG